MKVSILVILLLFTINLSAQNLEIHYGLKLDDNFSKILLGSSKVRKARVELEEIAKQQGIKIIDRFESSEEDLITSLNNSKNIGVLWLGHSKASYTQDGREKHYYNYFLVDADGKYISKEIKSASHKDLKFFGLNTCFQKGIVEKYSFHNQSYDVFLTKMNESENTFDQLSSILAGTITLYDKAKEALLQNNYKYNNEVTSSVMIEVKYKDLISNNFGYDVLINGQLVGVLDKEDRRSISGKIKKILFPSINLKEINEIKITPTDEKRLTPGYDFPIDNILIESVRLNNNELIDTTYNLGDSDLTDNETGLSKRFNHKSLLDATFIPQLIIYTEN